MQSYELLCDMIDVVIDISGIYGASEWVSFEALSLSLKLSKSLDKCILLISNL